MSVLNRQTNHESINLERWPDLAPPKSAPVRAAIAHAVLRRVANKSGIRVAFPTGRSFGPSSGPVMTLRDPRAFFARLGARGKIGFGESFMAEEWVTEDLFGVLSALAERPEKLIPKPFQILRRWYEKRRPGKDDNNREGAKRNISYHYDLSNELFATFLDKSMTYSSAYFLSENETLEEAQARKIERLLDESNVKEGMRVLEIGTGWGELALRAARRGAHVTSVTLSKEQAALAQKRVVEAGLSNLVDIRVQDYRDVEEIYDAVVSVEMIEAVGEDWWPTYFNAVDQRLVPGGRFGLQSILMSDDRLQATKNSWTWIHKYIFPGGIIPSEEAIDEMVHDHTSMTAVDRVRFGASYATTLRRWRERFLHGAKDVANVGFDGTFRRMWEFYLAYCESGFHTGYLDVGQFIFVKSENIPSRSV